MNLDRSEFRAWLESGPLDEVAGACRMACDCPIARYLRDLFGGSTSVDHGYYFPPSGERGSNPDWVIAFIDLVDGDRLTGQTISRGECLALLDEVPR